MSGRGSGSARRRSVSARLLSILDCFDVEHPELTLTEIASAAELPLSTARRLIMELVEWGGLERLPEGTYRIGTRLRRIGALAQDRRELSNAALPRMRDLHAVTKENVQLAVLDGDGALCIAKLSSPDAAPIVTRVGGLLPLHATAVGKVLLAYASGEVLGRIAKNGLRRMTPHTITEAGRLAAALHRIRGTGVGFSYEEMTIGAASVAAPIVVHDRHAPAALGVVTHSHANLGRLVPAVRAAAGSVSHRLGLSDPGSLERETRW